MNLVNFDPTLGCLKICTLMRSFRPKYIVFELEKTEELYIIILKIDANFEGKMTCSFINDRRNWVNFNRALKNLKIYILTDCFVQGI